MDPISALGVAAAAFQFVDLGGKLCIKAWQKYQQMRKRKLHDQQLEEEDELEKVYEDLSLQISWIQDVFKNIMVSQPPTPTEVQLLELSSQCTSLSRNFRRIESQMKLPDSRETNSEIHMREHVYLDRPSRRHVPEKNCRECKKRRDEEKSEFYRNKDNIIEIEKQLAHLKRKTVDFILISLWDGSKHTKQWDLHFSTQLATLLDLLQNPERITTNTPLRTALTSQEASKQDQSHDMGNAKHLNTAASEVLDKEMATLRTALQPLIQPGEGPISLKQLAEDIVQTLDDEIGAIAAIREDLVKFLWKNDWKLDASMALANIDTTMVAHAIAEGIQFSNIQTREEAISENFEKTFSWIFLDEPPKQDKPMWSSFPEWLRDNSKKIYWITGKPGSGKSTMMKLILQQTSVKSVLSYSIGPLRLLLVKYYAWLPGSTLQKSIEGLKRTIVSQALEQFPELAPALTPRRWAFCQVLRSISGLPMWDTWEIEESFEALLSSCGKTIKLALFIDGLDEFDAPTVEIIRCIQHIAATCSSALKICVASRPWPDFQDEFNENPTLQMHLLTANDMKIFVIENFRRNKGFMEREQLNSSSVSQLTIDIVQRANRVFLWVSIVVRHLLILFSEGQSVFKARQVLETLPTDLSSLYDAIWATIRPENLPDASSMLQVLKAFHRPMPWLKMWLTEELRFAPEDPNTLPKDDASKDVALRLLKRKLVSCTKCILEISGSGNHAVVDFIHRTARDWVLQPEKWQLICSSSGGQFDPNLCILKAEIIILSLGAPLPHTKLWDAIARILLRAGKVKDIPENVLVFINCMNSLENHFKELLRKTKAIRDIYRDSICYGFQLHNIDPTFLGLAAQFSVLPYIKIVALLDSRQFSQTVSKCSLGLLENAIFGRPWLAGDGTRNFYLQIPDDRRFATVKYLLDQGVYQSRVHSENGDLVNIKEGIQSVSQHLESEYYSKVLLYLDERNNRIRARSIRLRIRSLFS